MLSRILMSVVLVLAACASSRAEPEPAVKVGDQVVLSMTGKLAIEYARQTGSRPEVLALDGLSIETIATVASELGGGRVRIEHTSHVVRDGENTRLVTLTATIDPGRVTVDTTPKDTAVYASPDTHRRGVASKTTAGKTRTLRLGLSDLKDLKLRTWNLVQETGD